jgi:predicted Zn-dependent peptidase
VIRALPLVGLLAAGAASAQSFEVNTLPTAEDRPQVLLARRPGPVATLRVTFAAGSVDDGGILGLTRLAQHALLVANRRLTPREFLLAVHAGDARLELETTQRDCSFVLTADKRDFLPLARLLLDALLAPKLDPARLPDAVSRAVLDGRGNHGIVGLLTSVTTADDGRYLNPPHAGREDLETITPATVARHVAGRLSPANATVVVTGAFDDAEVKRLLRTYAGGSRSGRVPLVLPVPFKTRRGAGSELQVLAYPLRLATAEDAAAARVARELVDVELWRRFRANGLAYSHDDEVIRSFWLDLLLVAVPARDQSGLDLEGQLRGPGEWIRTGGFPDAELERARSAALAALAEEDEDPGALAAALARGGPQWHGPDVGAAIRAVDRKRLLSWAETALAPGNSIYLYFGPRP